MTAASKDSLLDALLAVQKEAPTLKKGETATVTSQKGSSYTYQYISLDTIVEIVGPLLVKNGLVWSTMPSFDEASGEPTLRYKLAHVSGGPSLDGEMKLLLGDKRDAQGQGSAITYARRYALCAVLNLVAEDDDDGARASAARAQSGEANGRAGRRSDKQVGLIYDLHKQNKATVRQLKVMLAEIGVPPTEDFGEGWVERLPLTGGREGTASAFIERLKQPLPKLPESATPASDVPEPEPTEFVHETGSLEGTPWAE